MTADIDCIVIGAGVVGLAIARALSLNGREVLVVEAAEGIGTGTSSRNSEVIHAGIYYPAGSLKARLCVEGKRMLYQYCVERGIPHRRLGKLIVATAPRQMAQLDGMAARAHGNGVTDLERLTRNDILALEPALDCVAALLSPSTGIVDSHALMLSLQGEAEHAGAQCVFHTSFLSGQRRAGGGFVLDFGGDEAASLSCNTLVNAAGIHAPQVAQNILGIAPAAIPQRYFCKGTYFGLKGRAPFSRLIYPVPVEDGLGIHLSLDLGGQAKFGPDTEWVPEEDYKVDPARAQGFYAAIRTYWPDLPDDALVPGYTGIRPKISAPGQAPADFVIDGPREHGVHGLLNLFGIESPGLTASLAIAQYAENRLFQ